MQKAQVIFTMDMLRKKLPKNKSMLKTTSLFILTELNLTTLLIVSGLAKRLNLHKIIHYDNESKS